MSERDWSEFNKSEAKSTFNGTLPPFLRRMYARRHLDSIRNDIERTRILTEIVPPHRAFPGMGDLGISKNFFQTTMSYSKVDTDAGEEPSRVEAVFVVHDFDGNE